MLGIKQSLRFKECPEILYSEIIKKYSVLRSHRITKELLDGLYHAQKRRGNLIRTSANLEIRRNALSKKVRKGRAKPA